jgi:hypothetical protein
MTQGRAFLAAWKNAISLAGYSFFGDGTPTGCAVATDKNQLRPRWEIIEPAFPDLTDAEQVFLAHVLTFFNAERSGWPVARFLLGLPNASLGHASARLDSHRRDALASLLTTYEGW